MTGVMKVLVLMSTYNGEKYIKEQVESILAQEGVDVFLLVRDDGSKDKTCEILDEYARTYENIEVIKAENVGFVKSFSNLAEMAQDDRFMVDYYAFSDQDDVWMPYKLKTACENLDKKDQDKPLLFSSNSLLVDSKLNKVGMFHENEPFRTKENVMLYSTEQGCTMVFNKRALELYNLFPPSACWHDRYLCLICNFMGEMFYTHEPLVNYRLHENNVLGKSMTLIQRIENDLLLFLKENSNSNYNMVLEFYMCYKSYLSNSDKDILNLYIKSKCSLKRKLMLIFSNNYHIEQSFGSRFRKSILILFNKMA